MTSITRPLPPALLIGLAVGIAIGVAVTAIASAQGTTETADVRITARLLENGKVEFGLQQQEGGGWGETILPRVNKFPYATATVDRWLYSSSVTLAAAAPAPVARTWRRDAAEWAGGYWHVKWRLAGTGEYAADGRAGYAFDAAPQLELSCVKYEGMEAPTALVFFSAEKGYSGGFVDSPGLRARVTDGNVNRVQVYAWDRVSSVYSASYAHAFMDWLAVNYARSRFLTLEADIDWALDFSGTFDLTGLPAVLADLPCYE